MRHRRRKPLRQCSAFTLLEVLAALLVLGLALTAWQLRIATHLDSAAYLRDKTVATWVVQNQLELLRIARRRGADAPLAGLQGSTTMAGTTWYWALTSQMPAASDAAQSIAPVTIGVSAENPEAARTTPLVTITGVIDASR